MLRMEKDMKPILCLFCVLLLASACSPLALNSAEPSQPAPARPVTVVPTVLPVEPDPTALPPVTGSVSGAAEQAVDAAISFLAGQLGLDPNDIQVQAVTAVEWADACLGIYVAGEMCAEVITPGYEIVLQAEGEYFTFHTDSTGRAIRVLPTALLAARQALSELTGLSQEQITLVSLETVEWPNSCLGVDTPGVSCLDVITPGYRIILEAGGAQYEYHTNQDGHYLILAPEVGG